MEDIKKIGTSSIPDLTGIAQGKKATKSTNEDVSKTEFLQILVTQLQSQDPLDPMKNDQFAVDLAQFSQLEQLISINDKIGGGSDISSLAGYLGQEVTLNTDKVHVENGKGGSLKFDLPYDAMSVSVELMGADGKLAGTLEIGELAAGEHAIPINLPELASGDYAFKVLSNSSSGGATEPKASVVGTVSGFIPGPDPQLIVGGQEVSPSQVVKVNVPTPPKSA